MERAEPNTLILVGFMGAGKTTVGREIARQHQSQFIDLDAEVERVAGMSIPDLFARQGEVAFRQLETQVLASFQNFNGVVATGGGIVERPENSAILKQSDATVVYLHGDIEMTIGRLLSEGERPLLQKSSITEFFALWRKRDPKYQDVSDVVIETVGKKPSRIAAEIIALLSAQIDELALLELRSQIDALDRQLFQTIEQRLDIVHLVGEYKQKHEVPVVQNDRMDKMKLALKDDFKESANITENMVDEIMQVLLASSIQKENDFLNAEQ